MVLEYFPKNSVDFRLTYQFLHDLSTDCPETVGANIIRLRNLCNIGGRMVSAPTKTYSPQSIPRLRLVCL